MSKLEKIYGVIVLLILLQLGYSFIAQGVLLGTDAIWGIFAFYSIPQVVIMLPVFFLLIRAIYRYSKGTFPLHWWSFVQIIVYVLASLYVLVALPQIVTGFLVFLI